MAEKWGDSTKKYGDNTRLYGDVPFDYPRQNHVSITIDGTAYTSDTFDDSYRIVEGDIPRLYFTFEQLGISTITDHDEVILTDQSQDRMFGGFVETITSERSTGPFFTYDVVAIGYAWMLDYPTAGGLVTKVWSENTADSTIISDVFGGYMGPNEIDYTTNVSTVETFTDITYFENLTPRQVLDALARRTGATWWVDHGPAGSYKCYLHYKAVGSKDAPYELRDQETAAPDYVTYFPYDNLQKRHEHGVCTKVIVEGDITLVDNSKQERGRGMGDGSRTSFDIPYKLLGRKGQDAPLVWDANDNALKVGWGGEDTLTDYDVLYYPDDLRLEFATAPPASTGAAFSYGAREIQRVQGTATDETGQARYGRHLVKRVRDLSIKTTAQANLMAAALLDRWKSSIDTYTCTAYERGLHRGQVVAITNSERSLSAAEYEIKELTARAIGGGFWAYDLELGQHTPTVSETVRDLTYDKLDASAKDYKVVRDGWVVSQLSGTDPVITFRLVDSGGTADDEWTIGVDDSDGDKFKIDCGSSLSDTAAFSLTCDGTLLLNGEEVTGAITGPDSSTDNAIVRWDGAGGDTIQDSGVTIDDSNDMISPGKASFGTTSQDGQVHIDQNDSGAAIPCLVLDQADVDEAFMLAIGTAASGDLTRSLVDEGDQGSETLEGWVMVEIQDAGAQIPDGDYWFPVYSLSA